MDLRLRRGCRTRENALLFLTQKAMEQPNAMGPSSAATGPEPRTEFSVLLYQSELVTIQRVHHTGYASCLSWVPFPARTLS